MSYVDRLDESAGRRLASNTGKPLTIPAELKVEDPSRGFATPRDFLMSVIASSVPGNGCDPRLRPLAIRNWAQQGEHLTAGSDEHGGYSDPFGGFLLPAAFVPRLRTIAAEADPMGSYVTQVPMSAPIVNIPSRVDRNHSSSFSGGLRMYRRSETQTVTASRIEMEQIELRATSLMGVSHCTEELLEASPISFAALLAASFRDEYSSRLVQERLVGTGVGEFLGVLNSDALLTINKESGQGAATITYRNIVNMRARCFRYSQAIWIANHDTLPELMEMSLSIGTGGTAMWQPSAREDHPDLLLGRPLFLSEHAKSLGTAGDLILGNWREFLEGTYSPLKADESIHVRFLNHERTFRFETRNAAAPAWRSVLTPKNGATLSPFVVLQTRS